MKTSKASKNDANMNAGAQRLTVIGYLITLSAALLAIMHSDNKILGLEIIRGSFTDIIIIFFKMSLWLTIFSGASFIITAGYFNSFEYDANYESDVKPIKNLVLKWHKFVKWLHKKSYSFTIEIFALAFISTIYNVIAKLFGFYGYSSVVIAAVITGTLVLLIIIVVFLAKRNKNHK